MRISNSDMNRIAVITDLYECLDDYTGRVYFSNYEGGIDSPNETIAAYLRMIGEVSLLLSPEFKNATRRWVLWGMVGAMSFSMRDVQQWDEDDLLEIASYDMFRLSCLCDDWLETGKTKPSSHTEGAV